MSNLTNVDLIKSQEDPVPKLLNLSLSPKFKQTLDSCKDCLRCLFLL